LVEFFVRSFCPPDGIVVDPFAGSGTVGAVAVKTGRRFCLIDIRPDQIQLCKRRVIEARRKITQE
jgi:site-specific DNA-methyltransferase (adenine-specific)